MLRLFKHLKKSWASILLIFALLVTQAMCDLALPDYTSRIINVGVQQGGIEEVAPLAIRKSELDHIRLFLDEEDQKQLEESYQLIDSDMSQEEYDKYVKKYPLAEQEEVYVLKSLDEEKKEPLNQLLGKPMLVLSMLEGENDQAKAIQDQIMQSLPPELQNSGLDIMTILQNMPDETRMQMMNQMDEQLADMPDTLVDQAAIAFVKNEYDALGVNLDSLQTNYILVSGAKMLGIALASMTATILVGFIGAKVAARLARDLRKQVFAKVLDYSETEFKQFGVASLITRSTNDIQQVQMLMVMLLRIAFYAPIIGVGGVIKALNTNSSMAWIVAVAVMAILSLVIVLFAIVMPKFDKLQKLIDKLNLVTREILTGLPVIRAFSNEKHEEDRFDDANRRLTKTQLFVNRTMSCMMPIMMFMMNAVAVLIVWKGAHGINDGIMQVGDMLAFIQYTMQIIMAFLMISMFAIMMPRASVSMKRIDEVLSCEVSIQDPKKPKKFNPKKKGYVEFKNVSFQYPDATEPVLENISFVAKPGETTAFIGSTGSGKSTLINLIPRLFDVTKGEILVDGVNVKDVSQHDLHEIIGYVPQKGVLFSGTIASNIKYGNDDISDQKMKKAAQIAQAEEFIQEKNQRYQSPISQGGSNVSGGQKQRLSIARAVAKDPEIYIFDDSFSALDFKTDVALRSALKKETKDSTVLIVAQRISTILHAEQIIVLDEGKVVGIGTHKELLKTCPIYLEIAESQLSKEELEHE